MTIPTDPDALPLVVHETVHEDGSITRSLDWLDGLRIMEQHNPRDAENKNPDANTPGPNQKEVCCD